MKNETLERNYKKIKDKDILSLIDNYLSGDTVRAAERIMPDWDRDSNLKRCFDYFDKHERALEILFGGYYATFRNALGEMENLHEYTFGSALEQMIYISNSGFSDTVPDSVLNVREWVKNTGYYSYLDGGDVYYGSFDIIKYVYKKAVRDGRLTVARIIGFCREHPELLGMFLEILSETANGEVADFFCELIATAGLQDTIRVHVFASVFKSNGGSKYLVGRILEKAREEKWHALPAFTQTLKYADGYVSLAIDKRMRILADALDGNFEKYYGGSVGDFFFLSAALNAFDTDSFKTVIKTALLSGNALMRRAALCAATNFAYDLGSYKSEIIEVSEVLDFEDWSVITNSGARKQICDPVLVARLFDILDAMPKSVVKHKTDGNFNFPRDLDKTFVVHTFHDFYKKLRDSSIVRGLERRFDALNPDAQVAFLRYFGDVTELDMRKATIALLKSTTYWTTEFYDKQNIVLTYAEAVGVSEYLKTKRQDLKSRIIKEFLKSRDKEKIAKYLSEQPEEYKTAAAEEMFGAMGKKVKSKAADEEKETRSDAVGKSGAEGAIEKFERPKQLDELLKIKVKAEKFKPLPADKVKTLYDKIAQFIKEHADYEYKSRYTDSAVTLGSCYYPVAGETASRGKPDEYPLGNELAAIIRETLDPQELAVFCAAYYVVDVYGDGRTNEARFGKILGCEKAVEYIKNAWKSRRKDFNGVVDSVMKALPEIVMRENPRLPFELRLYLSESGFYSGNENYPMRLYIQDANNIDEDKLLLYAARRLDDSYKKFIAASEKEDFSDVDPFVAYRYYDRNNRFSLCSEVFATLYERGRITDELARYMLFTDTVALCEFTHETNAVYIGAENKFPKTTEFVRRRIDEMIDTECKRGALPTRYSIMLGHAWQFFGLDIYFKAAIALRGIKPSRNGYLDANIKPDAITHILRCAKKDRTDSYEKFAALCAEYSLTKEELILAALINPVYIDYTEKYLGIDGLKMTVYWFTAHLNEEISEERKEKIKEFSEIDAADFKDGAFDYKWYVEMVNTIDKADFKLIYDNAKYITVAGLHKRAQRFFDAVNGTLGIQECTENIERSRNKDYCLAYSLIPVKDRADLMARYEYLSEFLRLGKQFGAMRRASERRTVDIALENLARSAGYTDVNIFIYETEATDPSTLFQRYEIGGTTVVPTVDGYRVTLAAERDGRLEKLPASVAKDKRVAELKAEAKKETARIKRMRAGFERSMCERVEFTAEQLELISRQPVIDYLLSRLFFIADGRAAVLDGGKLKGLDGSPISARTAVIAHPVELKAIGALKDCITYVVKNNVKQPFKQALREIYEPTEDEKQFMELLRFKGFNVSIKKCFAALKGKGWGYSPDVGTRRVFYSSNTIAVIFRDFDLPYTYDWDDDERELECVLFYDRKSGKAIKLGDVDPITFSEACRDVDLVVAISANNAYDFENAMSTVEVRKNVLVSLCEILHLDNIGFLKDNIKITGVRGTYIVNIRTGLVFKEGVGNLAISTVRTGRKPLLLDFVDEDPVTADIISKALLLSDDGNIKDNAILS